MTRAIAPQRLGWKPLSQLRIPGNQDVKTVKILRLGVGGIGTFLSVLLIFFNWILGDKVIVPSSMSGSYYTSTRNLFVGSLCALGVFLIGYRHTVRQDLCTSFAGVCALAVAFAPTAPEPPKTEPAWINYLHHAAAGALIFTLGLFCWVVFAQFVRPDKAQPEKPEHVRAWMGNIEAWVRSAWDSLERGGRNRLYLICGFFVFLSGGFALYTGIWPTSWSTGWPSLYLFEAVAVFAFGVAWITAGWENAIDIEKQIAADMERQRGTGHPDTLTAQAHLAALYWSAGRTREADAVRKQVIAGLGGSQGTGDPPSAAGRSG